VRILRGKNRRIEKKSSEPAAALSRVKDWLAVIALVAGGAWAATVFVYEKYWEPRLSPASLDFTAVVVPSHETECCLYLNLDVTIKNVGRREAHLETAYIAVGGNEFVPRTDATSARPTAQYKALQSIANVELARTTAAVFGDIAPRNTWPTLLVLANVLQPGSILAPGEQAHRRLAFATLKSQRYISVRGKAVIGHRRPKETSDWHWRLMNDQGFGLHALPWAQNGGQTLRDLDSCAQKHAADGAECRERIMTEARARWSRLKSEDPDLFELPFELDTFVTATSVGQ